LDGRRWQEKEKILIILEEEAIMPKHLLIVDEDLGQEKPRRPHSEELDEVLDVRCLEHPEHPTPTDAPTEHSIVAYRHLSRGAGSRR
jgi:hypothetical protein